MAAAPTPAVTSKAARHARIVALLAEHTVRSQTELARLLADAGMHVTQATLSRDLDELGAVKLRTPDGVIVNLSGGEFSLLRAFVEHPQRVLTRDQLLDFARGPDSDAYDRAIDVQISRLRRKLGDGVSGGELIRTVRNGGYMFMARVQRR